MKIKLHFLAAVAVLGLAVSASAQRRATPVNLNVTFDDTVSQTAGLRSDGVGTYFNGQSSVSAQLTDYGWFSFVSGSRPVSVVYSTPVELGAILPVTMDTLPVNMKSMVTSLKFQDMAVGQRQCVGFAVNISLGDSAQTVRTIGYRAGRGVISNTAWVNAVRVSPDTWTLEPAPQTLCGGADATLDSVARIRDAATKGKTVPDIDYGRYWMPFRITLTRQ